MLYDLSHPLNNESPVYPGIAQPEFKPAATIEKNGYRETHFRFHSHLGTHIDAPAHMLKNGATLDKMEISAFCGKALIVEVEKGKQNIEKSILVSFINELKETDFVLFKTGWSQFWGENKYFENFPTLTEEALDFLFQFQLKGIGFDVISADPVESTDYKNHYSIFEKGMLIIENLFFPSVFQEKKGEFFCFPIPYENADGSPVRAVMKI